MLENVRHKSASRNILITCSTTIKKDLINLRMV